MRALFPFFLALVSAATAFAQNVVANWFPAHIGDRWIYRHETRDENGEGREHLDIHHWTTEETITGSWTMPEGTLAGRQVRVVEGSPRPDYRVKPDPAFLIRGDCLYSDEVSWDPQNHRLNPDFLKRLTAGYFAPDFCFPLAVGKTWGAPHWGERAPVEAKDWLVQSGPTEQKTFHITSISSYLGSGMTAEIWFEKGVGILREEEIHHGTIGEERTRLIRFQPASQR